MNAATTPAIRMKMVLALLIVPSWAKRAVSLQRKSGRLAVLRITTTFREQWPEKSSNHQNGRALSQLNERASTLRCDRCLRKHPAPWLRRRVSAELNSNKPVDSQASRSSEDNQRPHHVVLFMFQDVAVPHILRALDSVTGFKPRTVWRS